VLICGSCVKQINSNEIKSAQWMNKTKTEKSHKERWFSTIIILSILKNTLPA
jgi:hypothetical protein